MEYPIKKLERLMQLSILIPSYYGSKRISRLLSSMVENGINDDKEYEIIICDDGSPIEDYNNLIANVSMIAIENCRIDRVEHGGWISVVNYLVSKASGKVILLMDDDTLYPKGLLSVVKTLIKSIDHVGVLSWRSYGNGPGQSNAPIPGFIQFATQLAGYCMAFKKELWQELGGFDTRYEVYCSDSDFCLRAVLAGYPSYRVWWPLIPHEEHGCYKTNPNLERQRIVENDLAAFKNKWGKNGNEMENIALNKLIGITNE